MKDTKETHIGLGNYLYNLIVNFVLGMLTAGAYFQEMHILLFFNILLTFALNIIGVKYALNKVVY